jgi:gentisate 1,2-dioxygenase
MTEIDTVHARTVEVGYDEFCGALAARDLKALWSLQTQLMPNVPLPATQPWLWKWDTIYPSPNPPERSSPRRSSRSSSRTTPC